MDGVVTGQGRGSGRGESEIEWKLHSDVQPRVQTLGIKMVISGFDQNEAEEKLRKKQ